MVMTFRIWNSTIWSTGTIALRELKVHFGWCRFFRIHICTLSTDESRSELNKIVQYESYEKGKLSTLSLVLNNL